ncbi:hypothetical protein NO932_03710 [Pelagibacterium sp. 26DY04]|uniref:hypothetical protein n=1 Tax=Pelagibacterium sp. 26DY04 TaxID=2967130 RepID=UPI00281616E9|nr:hypothetical protein [Pelagibacterium sp. 26DY04]WMT87726.1 hypothetical protein NO932_03710 [Pelagibacterium sp. 26DY04]
MFLSLARGALPGLVLLSWAGAAGAVDEIDVVESHSDIEILLEEADFTAAADSSTIVMGTTRQFLDGRPVLAELELIEAITADRLAALKEASDTGVRFQCENAVVYLAEEWHIVGALDCAVHEDNGGAP